MTVTALPQVCVICAGFTGGTGATGDTGLPLGCFQAPVMLYFDESSVGGTAAPTSDPNASVLNNRFTYHGLTFGTLDSAGVLFLANQDFFPGYLSSSPNLIFTEGTSIAEGTITVSTGGNGAIRVISLFVSQPQTNGQSITISGTLIGANVAGCSGNYYPTNGSGAAVEFDDCIADTLILTGNTAIANVFHQVGLDTLLACAATPGSALTVAP